MQISKKEKKEIAKLIAKILLLGTKTGASYYKIKAAKEGDKQSKEKFEITETISNELFENFDTYSDFLEQIHSLYKESQKRKKKK